MLSHYHYYPIEYGGIPQRVTVTMITDKFEDVSTSYCHTHIHYFNCYIPMYVPINALYLWIHICTYMSGTLVYM